MLGFEIFWDEKKLDEIINKHNTVRQSIKELLIGNFFSFLILIALFFSFYLTGREFSLTENSMILFLNVFVWVNSIVLVFFLKLMAKEFKKKQKDDTGDLLAVINTINQKLLVFSSIFLAFLLYMAPDPVNQNIFIAALIFYFIAVILAYRMQAIALTKIYEIDLITSIFLVIASALIASFTFNYYSFSYLITL